MKKLLSIFITAAILAANTVSAQKLSLYDNSFGLSNSLINDVCIDCFGLIWVATGDGLARFDGKSFTNFSETTDMLRTKSVNSVIQAANGKVYIGTSEGLFFFDYVTEKFSEIEIHVSDAIVHPFISDIIQMKSGDITITTSGYGLLNIAPDCSKPLHSGKLNARLCSIYLQSIFADSQNRLWISSFGSGINLYDPETQRIESFSESASGNRKIPDDDVTCFCEDDCGNIYAGGNKAGLIRISANADTITRIAVQKNDKFDFSVSSLCFDSHKKLFVGTDGEGLMVLNHATQKLIDRIPARCDFDFSKCKIHSVAEDAAGVLWLGIYQKGLFPLPDDTPAMFKNYGYNAFSANSIGSNCIDAIAETDSEYWIGTDGDGIYTINKKTDAVGHFKLTDEKGESFSGNIQCFYNYNNKYMFTGTYADGFLKIDINTHKTVKAYRGNAKNSYNLTGDKVSSILKIDENRLWLTTLGGGSGIFDLTAEKFYPGILKKYVADKNANPAWANNIVNDKDGNLWISTYDGLLFVNKSLTHYYLYTVNDSILPSNSVKCVTVDHSGKIWAGTSGGVTVFDKKSGYHKIINTDVGLCNNSVCAISEDASGYIWISTHNGLSQYNPTVNAITNFYESDGLQCNEFSRNAVYKSQSGSIFFGGIKGVTQIINSALNVDNINENVLLTSFSKLNQRVTPNDKTGDYVIMSKSVIIADTVCLRESDNVFSIEFTSSRLISGNQRYFRYRLLGFEDSWTECSAQVGAVTYTNIPNGTYVFEICSCYRDFTSPVRRLVIEIYPPWYKTVWAQLLWIFIGFCLCVFVVMFVKEKVVRRQNETISEMKMQFFINISHEIRTPLTLIIDPLEKLLSKPVADKETSRLYKIMQINSERIYRLVNQLLDLRKIDKGKIMMKFGETEICRFTKDVLESCAPAAESKEVNVNFSTSDDEIKAWIDPENFEKILLNLFSNAVKFTPAGGTININISQNIQHTSLRISVEDTGIGLNPEDVEKIFLRFYQVKNSGTRYNTGTGVGLHLARYLVELHKGKLYAENRTDTQGSRFIIEIPLGNKHLPPQDLVTDDNSLITPIIHKPDFEGEISAVITPETPLVVDKPKPKNALKLMIVDDEEALREYLINEMSDTYNVVGYHNGAEAFKNVIGDAPDLIISDIMMPQMDGITLCKKIKRNQHTSHIPVILLTALNDDENRNRGIEIGADMYLVKPFDSKFLKKAIHNLLDNRKKVSDYAGNRADNFNIDNIKLKSQDEILMQKVMAIIKENISGRDLNVEMLADCIGISRVHLHRRLKEITGLSARDFIKSIRMKQASYLLTVKKFNISEVAYAVGYSNPAHFSSSFKLFYGVSPLNFVQNQAEADKGPQAE